MQVKIRWLYEGEPGYWTSSERRFAISPEYIGTTRPQSYALRDALTDRQMSGFDTVSDAKAEAVGIAEREFEREATLLERARA